MSTFSNPVYPGYFADPMVLPAEGRWWALGTSASHTVTGLVSDDLVRWTPWVPELSGGEQPLAGRTHSWAPELSRHEGRYCLYFSAGVEDRHHQIFVAESDAPGGPYEGVRPVRGVSEPFAIDAHVLVTRDGERYLFYAADRLDAERVGTSVVVQRMARADLVEGPAVPVIMPSADWQLFQRGRPIYGGVYDWHTCEGPFVVHRDARYWCLYSGGCWETPSYGMGAAWADHPAGPWHDVSHDGPTVIRTVPGRAYGPGHASVLRDCAGTDWLAYHAWDEAMTARRMHLDRLVWDERGPRCLGPTVDRQPAPVTRGQAGTGTTGG